MPGTVDVIPLTPVDGVFSYTVPDEFASEARPGARVVIPFGRRTITGVIAKVSEANGELKDILDVLDETPSFTQEFLDLTRWISEYYVCAWGDVLRAALPAGASIESRLTARLVRPPQDGDSAGAEEVFDALHAGPRTVQSILGNGITHHRLRRLRDSGMIELDQELQPATVRPKTVTFVTLTVEGRAPDAVDSLSGVRQKAILEVLQQEADEGLSQRELLSRTGGSSSTVKSLVARGMVATEQREQIRESYLQPDVSPPSIELHAAQREALAAISDALDRRSSRTFLLHGITGSGKTEVYIQALKHTLAQGRTGIVLVPEISLTPQTVRRFRAHFGDRVAVLHSRMSPGERFDAWRLLRDGRYEVAIGPRSAVFAPLANVGLIVVDEEHEASYKQFDPAPRYHARDVAIIRARSEGATCVLGSATPSLESLVNARSGKYELIRMADRVPVAGGRPAQLPTVRVVDLTWERKVKRLQGGLSYPLREAIGARLDRREGTILLHNRRGYSPVLVCMACGHTPECRDCSVSLTYHQTGRHLRCHYCGRVERLPEQCPECGEDALDRLGAGTQRIEEEIAEVFPAARVLRMDLDTTSRKNAHQDILDAFGGGEADILLGTQMVAKGLDFPRVTLVGIVDADTGLLLPDFRAAERSFQLLMQVAGRAGRADLPGEVILQTRRPEHPAVIAASQHDYDLFATTELADRQALGYPPFGRLAVVEFRGKDRSATSATAAEWSHLASSVNGQIEILGPEPAMIGRVRRDFRFQTILKAPAELGPYALSRTVAAASAAFGRPPSGVRINVDIDALGVA